MATSLTPSVIDALIAKAKIALPTAHIYDGYGVSDDPGDFLMVGVPDPDNDGPAESASTQQDWVSLGAHDRKEVGTIQCVALSWNGNEDGQKQARDGAYAMLAALENAIRADVTLGGVSGLQWAGCPVDQILRQNQIPNGVQAVLQFSVGFQGRI